MIGLGGLLKRSKLPFPLIAALGTSFGFSNTMSCSKICSVWVSSQNTSNNDEKARSFAFAVGNVAELVYLFEECLQFDGDESEGILQLGELRTYFEGLNRYGGIGR